MAHIVTGKVRLSYVNLFTPVANLSGKEKYSVVILIPKTDTQTKAKIDQAIQEAIEYGKAKKWGGKIPPMLPSPLHDGDGLKPRGGEYGPECKGHWVLNASSNADRKPKVVDLSLNPILDPSEIYSGVYARCGIDIYPFAAPGNSGLSCGISNVQKLADGEPLGGGGVSAESDFGGANAVDPFGF